MSESVTSDKEIERFAAFTKSLVGLPVSHIWRGYGSALFLEFGRLSPWVLKNGRRLQNDRGEMGLMIEWSWRIENEHSILAGSWSEEDNWNDFFAQLIGCYVTKASLFGRLPEIQLDLSNGMYLCSVMTADDDPSWAIFKNQAEKKETVRVVSGVLSWNCDSDDELSKMS